MNCDATIDDLLKPLLKNTRTNTVPDWVNNFKKEGTRLTRSSTGSLLKKSSLVKLSDSEYEEDLKNSDSDDSAVPKKSTQSTRKLPQSTAHWRQLNDIAKARSPAQMGQLQLTSSSSTSQMNLNPCRSTASRDAELSRRKEMEEDRLANQSRATRCKSIFPFPPIGNRVQGGYSRDRLL